jgi:LacI family transcriptional regulator
MRIAIDIPHSDPSAWMIAAGALEYACGNAGVQILLPHAPMVYAEDTDTRNWDAVIGVWARKDLNLPVVCTSAGRDHGRATVTIDEHEVARLAVDQFVANGLQSLAFVGNAKRRASVLRWECFSTYVTNLGLEPVYVSIRSDDEPWKALNDIPKPCGMMTWSVQGAFWLLKHCRNNGLQVPRDIQIISAADTTECSRSTPTLAGIVRPFQIVGFEAARLCHEMIKGNTVKSRLIPPSGLIVRESARIQSHEIKTAAEIAHYLRTHYSSPIQMEDVVRQSNLSRRKLEQVFHSAYGTSPIAFLIELRVDQVKRVLRSSDAPIREIAEACGYTSDMHLYRTFKKHVGLTPAGYREKHRQSGV